jgi:hypothetical protein
MRREIATRRHHEAALSSVGREICFRARLFIHTLQQLSLIAWRPADYIGRLLSSSLLYFYARVQWRAALCIGMQSACRVSQFLRTRAICRPALAAMSAETIQRFSKYFS